MTTKHLSEKSQLDKVLAGIKAAAVILPLLGITWIFGHSSFNLDTIAFKYIFATWNSFQGLNEVV